jgi:hypothetical protein
MDDPTPHEIDAMVDAGLKAGEYLESISKTDVAKLEYDEWMSFIEAVCTGFCDSMRLRAGMVMKLEDVNVC